MHMPFIVWLDCVQSFSFPWPLDVTRACDEQKPTTRSLLFGYKCRQRTNVNH